MYCKLLLPGWRVASYFRSAALYTTVVTTKQNEKGPSSPQNEPSGTVLKLLHMLEHKDSMLEHKDRMLEHKDSILERLHEDVLRKTSALKDSEYNLEKMTLQYLQVTGCLDARSVIEIFQERYIRAEKGKIKEAWNNFVRSEHCVAISLRADLEEAQIDVSSVGRIMKDLYAYLSEDIHKSLKSNDVLYLFSDRLTPDQLILMKSISCRIIPRENIKVITEQKWRLLLEIN